MLLRIFRRMYPTKLAAEGFPALRGLSPSNIVLTANKLSKIQQYGTMNSLFAESDSNERQWVWNLFASDD